MRMGSQLSFRARCALNVTPSGNSNKPPIEQLNDARRVLAPTRPSTCPCWPAPALLLRPLALRWVRPRRFGGGGREVGHAPLGRCRRCRGRRRSRGRGRRRRGAFTLVEPASDGAAGAAGAGALTGDGAVAFTATGTGAVACTLVEPASLALGVAAVDIDRCGGAGLPASMPLAD